ncbi:cytochrome P450 [Nocardia tengchongensis]|uniref:Cytochrome P450 n=1 Tax=Nocardia tengchongensis TaxID=2055889 RepID=A0ABX8CQB9_9NOCA|nr:cytochrome P450 [Nocardia tengchongensis]QVI21556.1 cytochrome P450 [Nocardia tengchongensis]
MLTRTWTRWLLMHGLARTYVQASARRGSPLGNLARGSEGLLGSSPAIEEIRRRGRIPKMSGVHITADFEVCRLILRDRRFGVVSPNHPALPKPIRWLLAKTDLGLPNLGEPPSMLVTDPPDHTRYRRMVGNVFGPKSIATLEERIAEVADDLIDRLESKPRPDLITDFSAQMPVTIIAEILGLPADMHSTLLKWGDSGAPLLERGLSWAVYRDAVKDLAEVKEYFDQHFDELTVAPRDDVLSMLVADDVLTRREQIANAALLLDAGFLTTVNMLGNGIALLTSHPDQLELLADQPWLWRNAVEEVLRYDGPVRMTGRVANCDVDFDFDHERIPSGSLVLLSLAGANHDPDVFPDPNRFDVTRDNAAEHLSFGSGIHGCLGARLARLEGTVALRALFDRYPNLRLDGPPVPHPLRNLHAYASMPAELGAARTPG